MGVAQHNASLSLRLRRVVMSRECDGKLRHNVCALRRSESDATCIESTHCQAESASIRDQRAALADFQPRRDTAIHNSGLGQEASRGISFTRGGGNGVEKR